MGKFNVFSPVNGKIIKIESVKDEMFSSKMLGDGIAIEAKDDYIYAPIDGAIESLYPSLHAIGIVSKDGVEVLIHIGINTCELEGKGFASYTKQGAEVKKGNKLLRVDHRYLRQKGYDDTIIVVITNTGNYKHVEKTDKTEVNILDDLLAVY